MRTAARRADGPADGQGDGRTRGFCYTSQENTRPNEKSWFFPHGFGFLAKISVSLWFWLESDEKRAFCAKLSQKTMNFRLEV